MPEGIMRMRFTYFAQGGETEISGADHKGIALAYAPGAPLLVFRNGRLQPPDSVYSASDGKRIGFHGNYALMPGDVVEVIDLGALA
jgi:hypothetical protein